MDHMLQLEHHNLKHCNPGTAGIRRSAGVSQVAFALATITFLSLFSTFSMGTSLSSSLSAQLLALCSFVMTKKALFVLSNVIFVFLAADYRCFFSICSLPSSSSVVTVCEPSGVLATQAQHPQEIEQCAIQPCVSYSGSLHHSNSNIASQNFAHPARKGEKSSNNAGISDSTMQSEKQEKQEDIPVSLQPELFGLHEEENSVTLEAVVVEEPTCGAAQELEKLDIDELNKKFEQFIQRRRAEWMEEEAAAYLQCQQV